jgi:hypothetical protein
MAATRGPRGEGKTLSRGTTWNQTTPDSIVLDCGTKRVRSGRAGEDNPRFGVETDGGLDDVVQFDAWARALRASSPDSSEEEITANDTVVGLLLADSAAAGGGPRPMETSALKRRREDIAEWAFEEVCAPAFYLAKLVSLCALFPFARVCVCVS